MIKITGTRSYIKIEIDGKVVKIEAEKIVEGFVNFKNTITNWEPPYENEVIDDKMKKEIVDKVINETKTFI